MDRRGFVALIGSAFAAPLVRAQKPSRLPVLGIVTPLPRGPDTPERRAQSAVRGRLRQLGWVDGESFEIDRPDAEGREERLPAIAADLVRKRVDVIWADGPEAAVAAARATKTIPIVFWGVGFPVEQGLIDSFARPGRNVTGIAFQTGTGPATKVLEFLKEIAPAAKRVAGIFPPSAITDVTGKVIAGASADLEAAARKLGLDRRTYEIAGVEGIEQVFAAILKARTQALVVGGTALTLRERKRFVEFANQNRLASAFNAFQFVDAGGLFSYGIDNIATLLHSLGHVDRILRGARPADLPVEMPSKYELVINMKTSKLLGLKVPQPLLLRADRVIE